ncbi:hypothetical protein J5N97_017739 [Dioscorea zingiberensis]|uniref:Inositol-1-monophosphatase n=1 Tax=Dioscorea zingiberensis TaxID=325984 RepID=A0A9D5CN11_9LILI|nr:hypothetical protein J5N97_017739 [Dioscorea zingiberensis]
MCLYQRAAGLTLKTVQRISLRQFRKHHTSNGSISHPFHSNPPQTKASRIPWTFSRHHDPYDWPPLEKVALLAGMLGRSRTRAALSEFPTEKQYPKVGAQSTGSIPAAESSLQVVETAAKTGAEVVMEAVNKPRNISYKGITDLVTDTDKSSESAILEVVRKNFSGHLILGEEGGLIGDTNSEYLWCIDPLAAASVVEFVGGPMCWNTRTFSATSGGGAFCNGQKIHVSQTEKVERSLLVTGFGYEHDDAWTTNINLFKEFTDISRGVRRLGAAAVDMSHVALGIVEAYWEYRLKPWDMAAGVLIVEEAGGVVTLAPYVEYSNHVYTQSNDAPENQWSHPSLSFQAISGSNYAAQAPTWEYMAPYLS